MLVQTYGLNQETFRPRDLGLVGGFDGETGQKRTALEGYHKRVQTPR